MKIIGQMIVRNEQDRYLETVIPRITAVVDKLIILDDASEDDTVKICKSFPKVEIHRGKRRRWLTDESGLRSRLWEYVRDYEPDWVLSLDADEVLDVDPDLDWEDTLQSGKGFFNCRFYEMWDEDHYRVDGYWSKTITPIFRFRDVPFEWAFSFHCPRQPRYVHTIKNGGWLSGIKVRHLAYITPESREKKLAFYEEQNKDDFTLEHSLSILSVPKLLKYGEKKEPRVMIASPMRDRVKMLPEFLGSLKRLDYPADYHFIVNDSEQEQEMLETIGKWQADIEGKVKVEVMNFGTDPTEHVWSDEKLNAMRVMRNRFLANLEEYDYLFEVDCGIIFPDPGILGHLISLNLDVVSPVFWARWHSDQEELGPNVWLTGGDTAPPDFVTLLKHPGLYPVGGLGAVTLISKKVYELGITYKRVHNLPDEMRGEDRDFCVRCVVHGIKLWADSFYPVTHLDSASTVTIGL